MKGLLNNYLLRTSDLDYTNNMLLIDWLKHFNLKTAHRQISVYRLFIFDGFGSYLTKKFIEYYNTNKIISFSLLTYLSYNL